MALDRFSTGLILLGYGELARVNLCGQDFALFDRGALCRFQSGGYMPRLAVRATLMVSSAEGRQNRAQRAQNKPRPHHANRSATSCSV